MIDKYGLYVQANGGNGDSAHRSGLAAALHGLLGEKDKAKKIIQSIKTHLEISSGTYIRHPADYPGDWSEEPNNFSRDQASRVILAYAVNGEKQGIKRWLWAMAKRGFFHQNYRNPVEKTFRPPDIMAPGEWRNIIRGLDLWFLYPVLLILDLFFFGDIYFRKPWDGASLYVPDLKYALKKYWTPVAWCANIVNNKTPWLKEALDNHAEVSNGCVELQPLFIKLDHEK